MRRSHTLGQDATGQDILQAAADAGDSERVTLLMEAPTPIAVRAARSRLVDLVARDPETVIVDGVTRVGTAPQAVAGRRYAWGRLAVERVLILSGADSTQVELAAAAGISQQAVSKIMRDMSPHRSREVMLDAWLRTYPALTQWTSTWSSVADPWDQAGAVTRHLDSMQVEYLVSGDPAQGALAPYRLPCDVTVYVDHPVSLEVSGFVAVTAEPTLTVKVPADPTVWATARWFAHQHILAPPWPIADPLVVLADMYRARGPGAFDAAESLRQAIVDGRLCRP
jgi:hypothetical protein